jgi:hypothetical protein
MAPVRRRRRRRLRCHIVVCARLRNMFAGSESQVTCAGHAKMCSGFAERVHTCGQGHAVCLCFFDPCQCWCAVMPAATSSSCAPGLLHSCCTQPKITCRRTGWLQRRPSLQEANCTVDGCVAGVAGVDGCEGGFRVGELCSGDSGTLTATASATGLPPAPSAGSTWLLWSWCFPHLPCS